MRSGTLLKMASESRCSILLRRRPRVSEMRAAIRESPRRRRAYVCLAHDAHHDLVEGFSEAVVHLLSHDDHLAEDRAGFDDRGGEGPAVGGNPEDANAALLEDEQRLQGLVRGVDQIPRSVGLHRRGGRHDVHLTVAEIAKDVDLGHAPDPVVGVGCGAFDVHVFLSVAWRPGTGPAGQARQAVLR